MIKTTIESIIKEYNTINPETNLSLRFTDEKSEHEPTANRVSLELYSGNKILFRENFEYDNSQTAFSEEVVKRSVKQSVYLRLLYNVFGYAVKQVTNPKTENNGKHSIQS